MKEKVFRFKQFSLRQHDRVHKVGTDGVLLGAWVNIKPADQNILDAGTGTSLIALMLAQRSKAFITGIEPDPTACALAIENAANSPFTSRVTISQNRLQDLHARAQFDLIVINPPFFENQLRSPNEQRNGQRHNDSLPFHELIAAVKELLKESGRLAVILPIEEGLRFKELAQKNGFHLSRITEVHSKASKPPFRLLMELDLQDVVCEKRVLVLENDQGHRSEAYHRLTEAFYL
ncbi:MAG: tRNA1(Val) (adenine(37)-N6)-methyltransferase [Cyclobacteriaceae bacterium]